MATRKKSTKKPVARSVKPAPKKSARKITATPLNKLRIGKRYAEFGGVYMGIAVGENRAHNYMVFRGRYADKKLNHADALKFAADCKDGKFTDWELPNRTTGALLYANGRDDARQGWHWLKETYAGDVACAWCQYFRLGDQSYFLKRIEFEVVLVRRVLIQ